MLHKTDIEPVSLARAALEAVMYADIFDYPLTVEEIQRVLPGCRASLESVVACLQAGYLPHQAGYYTLPGRESTVATRRERLKTSMPLWFEARRYGRLISALPFVRMVAVTGSLAMNNTEAGGDIDYLVVTRPGRLWLCRLFVLSVVRLAAARGINLCPNYLITENALAFPERSLYAAHEFVQMVPLSGPDIYTKMYTMNTWVAEYLPNAEEPVSSAQIARERKLTRWLKSSLECLLNTPPAGWIERWEMDRKIRKLAHENSGNPEAVFSADQCKGHANRHGWRVRSALESRAAKFAPEMQE